jgi:uncharacterized membrane protein
MLSEHAVRGFELVGSAAIVVGAVLATLPFITALIARATFQPAYRTYRQRLGQAILLGLELLVAADIINTVGVDPTLSTVAVLAGVVLIRTFLSFSLEVEIEGRWPWQRGQIPDEPQRCSRRMAATSERARVGVHPAARGWRVHPASATGIGVGSSTASPSLT